MCEGAFVPSAYVGRGVKHTEAALNVKKKKKPFHPSQSNKSIKKRNICAKTRPPRGPEELTSLWSGSL